MSHPLSLAFLTLFDATPVEAIRAAAKAGFDMVGLRLVPSAPGEPEYPIMTDDRFAAEVQAELRASGISVADVEIVRLNAMTRADAFEPFLQRAAQLGARNILVAGDDPDEARLTQNFASFCELASRYGMTADLEFMPWTKVPNLSAARRIVEAAGAANGGVLVDALHWDRAGDTVEAVKALPPSLIHYVQFCDGKCDYDPSDEGLIAVARGARLFPGEGNIDLGNLARAIPPGVVISVEVPDRKRAKRLGFDQRAELAITSTRECLAQSSGAK